MLESFWTPQSLIGTFTWNQQHQIYIGKSVKIHPSSYIESHVFIGGNSVVQEGISIFSSAKIGSNVTIGSYSIIRENFVVGWWVFVLHRRRVVDQ